MVLHDLQLFATVNHAFALQLKRGVILDRTLNWVGAIVVAVWVAGCASTQFERKEAASSSMVELRDSMVTTRGQIEKALVSLNGLMTAPPDDLRRAYNEFAKDTDEIAQQAVAVEEESRQLRRRSADWLAGWQESQADVQDPELKALSEKRRAQALERIQNIDRSLAEAREAFAPFVANLQDVKMVVGNDLTPSGVAAVSGTAVVQNANQNGATVARALAATIVDLQVLTQTRTPHPSADSCSAPLPHSPDAAARPGPGRPPGVCAPFGATLERTRLSTNRA